MPIKSEILEHIDHAYELAHEAGTARWRLYDLLKNGEFSEADRLEALVLVKGIDPDALTLAVAAIRRDIDGGGDDDTAPAVDDDESDGEPAKANPGSSGMVRALGKVYESQYAIQAMLRAIMNTEIAEPADMNVDGYVCAALCAANKILDAADEIATAAGVDFHFDLLTGEDRRKVRHEMWGAIG